MSRLKRFRIGRDRIVFGLIAIGFIAILVRAFYVQVIHADFLIEEGDKRQVRNIEIPAPRGEVFDRHGAVLALSTPMASVSVDAKMMTGYQRDYTTLLSVLGMSEADLIQTAKRNQHKRLSFIKSEANPVVIEKLERLELPGLYLKTIDMALKLSDGRVIKIEKETPSVWVDLEQMARFQQAYTKIAKALGMNKARLQKKMESNAKRRHMYVKRLVEPEVAHLVEQLNLYGVYVDGEYKRYYPEGEIASHLIGFTNIDDQGQEGVELAYNDWLKGTSGKKQVIKDRSGNVIDFVKDVVPAKPGKPVTLTIDKNIQYFAYRALKATMVEHQARSASAVVLDAKTGEVLAMVSLPGYNPNDRSQVSGRAIKNRVISDLMEPGSTVKPFIIAKALHEGVLKIEDEIDTSPGSMRVQGYRITDSHNNGLLTAGDIIQKSSNVGASKIALKLTPEQQFTMYKQVGFSESSDLYLPGESGGSIKPVSQWQDLDQTSASYGYGFSINLLSLAHAYLLFANDGQIMPVTIFKGAEPAVKTPVVSPYAANQTLLMMERVVAKGGTAPLAQIPGYRVAGKTGTTHKTKRGGYEQNEYISQFAGIVPVSDPDMVMIVRVNEPSRGVYFGGSVTAPVFKEVMEQALRLRNVPHDMPIDEAKQM